MNKTQQNTIENKVKEYNDKIAKVQMNGANKHLAMMQHTFTLLGEIRKELGVTQREIADKIGTKDTYISRVENGKSDIQLSSFLRILDACGLKINLKVD